MMQYAKQFAYLECKIANISSKTICDCEKKNDQETDKSGTAIPSQKNHTNTSLDEYVISAESFNNNLSVDLTTAFSQQKISFLSSYCCNIFHPPQA
jgi:hypothetical protein